MSSLRFDIIALGGAGDESMEVLTRKLRALLAERFALVARREAGESMQQRPAPVAGFMSRFAASTIAAAPVPAADLVWLKASLVHRWNAERQAQRPLDAMQSIHIGLGLVAAVVLFVWSAPALLTALNALQP